MRICSTELIDQIILILEGLCEKVVNQMSFSAFDDRRRCSSDVIHLGSEENAIIGSVDLLLFTRLQLLED